MSRQVMDITSGELRIATDAPPIRPLMPLPGFLQLSERFEATVNRRSCSKGRAS